MVRYFYAWGPFFIVGTVLLLSLPWLGFIALMFAALIALLALAALGWATLVVPYKLTRAISRHWRDRTSASPRTTAALSPARRQNA
jgi:ABC-type transport system involved in cytochrome bd biosynthesis fused ATPase/permease subunit